MSIIDKEPIGSELVKRGIVVQDDIEKALEYQSKHPEQKIGDILYKLRLGDPYKLAEVLGDVLNEKTMIIEMSDIVINIEEYLSIDMCNQFKAIPFEINNGIIKVCFSSIVDNEHVETVRILLLNKGLLMERYVSFQECIDKVLYELKRQTNKINIDQDVSSLIDNIIKDGMRRRASDIHIEPTALNVRVRYRIDGELLEVARIEKAKQEQIIGRLKSISNMHQEKQEPQDGRITMFDDYNIRSSSQKNIYGEKFVLRLLKKNQDIKNLFDLGFPRDPDLLKEAFEKNNSITVIAAPTGEGKTTTLYSAIDYLNKPEINITTIEDPVEIRIEGLNQIEIDKKISFASSLRTVLRQDPNIILVGEIRDQETAEIAMQAGQTGHYVLTTLHTINAIETISRLRKMNISDYDIASTVATSISQRLVRKLCPECKKERPIKQEERELLEQISEKYNSKIKIPETLYDSVGCELCNNTGFYDRIAIYEILVFSDTIKDLVIKGKSTMEIREQAYKEGYRPFLIEGLKRVTEGITSMEELNNKLLFF